MNPNDADTPETDTPIAAAPADESNPPEAAAERPKRPRAPRKKAVAANVGAADSEPAAAENAPLAAPADAPALVGTQAAMPVAVRVDVAADGIAGPSQGEPANVGEGQAGDTPAVADDGLSEGQRRGRNRRRGRRSAERAEAQARAVGLDEGQTEAQAAGADDGSDEDGDDAAPKPIDMPRPQPAEVGEVFAEVLSGAYDVEPAVDEAPAVPGRRVLAAEPDAPKLHKVLAQAGVGSRRDLEQMILDGRVTVNGEAAHVGQRISFGDRITVAGKPIKYRIAPPPARVLAYHKPAGEVVTHDDPQQRPTVFRRLPRLQQGKWQSVGRLDINTEGLLLFTNSGELANQLMHPRFGVEREYAVRSLGVLEAEGKARLLEGVSIDGQTAAFKSIEDGGGEGVNHWYRVVITEGRNREVRKLFEAVGHAVSRLIRIRYGSVVLPRGLKRGAWVDLHDDDVRALRQRSASPQPERPPREEGDRGPQAEDGAARQGRGRRGGAGGRGHGG
jgi:23S rRNA pseudouridine2605 synthase